MRCMKTGLRFNVPEFNDDTYHGDLFYNKTTGIAFISGIARDTSTMEPAMKMIKYGDAFSISSITNGLENMIKIYFPDVSLDTLKVLIVDTRFY